MFMLYTYVYIYTLLGDGHRDAADQQQLRPVGDKDGAA